MNAVRVSSLVGAFFASRNKGMWTRLRGRGPFPHGCRKVPVPGESRREYRKRLNGGWLKD